MRIHGRLTLRLTLSVLVVVSVILTALVVGYSAVRANAQSLTSSYLTSNYQYAKKLALNTGDLLALMQKNIDSLSSAVGRAPITQAEFDNLLKENQQYFNSILYVDADRKVQAVSPANAGVKAGTQLNTEQVVRATEWKRPLISDPYVATTKRLILLVSSPVFNEDGTYIGFVGGTIYLEEDNVLSRLLNEHFYGNGSYVYVVDKSRHLIFHPNKERFNQPVGHNEVIDKVLQKESGSQKIVNSEGKEFFAGYAFEPNSGWGIISQTPTSVLKDPLHQLIINIILEAFPLFLMILLISWWVAHLISRPLHQLAKFSEESIFQVKSVPSELPENRSHIYEVKQLYQSINNHLSLLNAEIQLDGLTGLANRKTFDLTIKEWMDSQIPFSLILLDIDHFKEVNDKHGHVLGDEVLKYLASTLRAFSRENDVCLRYGGEEFGILVKSGEVFEAAAMAESLRKKIAETISPTGEAITISIGLSCANRGARHPKELIELADHALYQSKSEGRNRVTLHSSCYERQEG